MKKKTTTKKCKRKDIQKEEQKELEVIDKTNYRQFMILLYEDTTSYDYEEVINKLTTYNKWAYIKHIPESNEKKEHIHFILILDNKTSISAISKRFGMPNQFIQSIKDLTKLGPLHIPGNLAGIEAMQAALPEVPMVAVYDTAFHQTMPKENYIYPVPMEWYTEYGVRKYGFHGTSHKYITGKMKEKLGKEDVNLIICHIGSGASISAIKEGKCYDTTMGLTPLDGLMMGTRSGAIDPSIIEYVCGETGKSVAEVTNDLNKKSGLLGVAGKSDSRDVELAAADGNEDAALALEMYNDRVAKYIVQYYIELEGKVDSIVFTAGVGENGREARLDIMKRLAPLGIKVDAEVNDTIASYKDINEGVISTEDSTVRVEVVPTNEEIMIIKDTYELVK